MTSFSTSECLEARVTEALYGQALCRAALLVPRRLGGEATPAELAADKKFWKRMLNYYEGSTHNWMEFGGFVLLPTLGVSSDKRLRAEASVADPDVHLEERRGHVTYIDLEVGSEAEKGGVALAWRRKFTHQCQLEIGNLDRLAESYT